MEQIGLTQSSDPDAKSATPKTPKSFEQVFHEIQALPC